MELWTSGEILDLLHEGATIQKDLRPSNTPSIVAKIVADTPEQVHPTKFQVIDADIVKRAAVRTRGEA